MRVHGFFLSVGVLRACSIVQFGFDASLATINVCAALKSQQELILVPVFKFCDGGSLWLI